MSVTVQNLKQRARKALPYFQQALGEPGHTSLTEADIVQQKKDYPRWLLRVEEAARAETDASWNEDDFYGLVAETLRDLIEYGDHRWEEEGLNVEEIVDAVATDFSLPTLNMELYEWARHSPEWSDVAHELRDDVADDGDLQLELIQESMGEDVLFLRRAVLSTLLQQLQEQDAETEVSG